MQQDQTQRIIELEGAVKKLESELQQLSQSFFKNNFSSYQVFAKDVVFQTRLKVPSYSTPPSICEIGDIIEVGGKLYICTVANTTFTLVGSQS